MWKWGLLVVDQIRHRAVLPVDQHLQRYVADAVDRLRYLYPGMAVEAAHGGIAYRADDPQDGFERDAYYTLYRARIAAEGAELRNLLYRTVLAP